MVCVRVSICLCLSVCSSRPQGLALHTMYCLSHRDDTTIDNDYQNNMAATLRILHGGKTGSAIFAIIVHHISK